MMLLCLLLALACGQQCKTPTGNGRKRETINVDGISRKYEIHVPNAVKYPASLVFAWHGISSSPTDIESRMQVTQYADNLGFILVFPNTKNFGSETLFNPAAFNGASCCKNDPTFNDVATFKAIKAQLISDGCVDADRVYSFGYSNGGFMTHRVACEDANNLRAAAVHSGTWGDYAGNILNSPWRVCDKKKAVPMLGIMGTADSVVPFLGGPNPSPFSSSRWGSFAQQMDIWAVQNSCGAPTSTQYQENGRMLNQTTFAGCGVDFTSVEGLGHEWWGTSTARIMAHFQANDL
jgi:polyhydroxybutyrate depolymerase